MDTAKVIMVDLTTFEELSAVIDQLLDLWASSLNEMPTLPASSPQSSKD
jgi:hypothetical protein